MPQLTPDPWFNIFTMCWLILTILPTLKILQHLIHNTPSPKHFTSQHNNWTWPWL
uniref:ATP synthase complex subunit 8 n=1 Tax=Synapturanus sp. MNHN-RA-2020.0079 TaxID=2877830 RepID=A0A8K1HA61_9NEOB|nr:ATP synthase F0 subunit 8 [Synapturanus sp. MNHN-RA-2020.0079]